MRHEFALSVEFSAGHKIDDDPLCATFHGHDWKVDVVCEGGSDPRRRGTDVAALRAALEQIGKELNRRDLGVMLPGMVPNTQGVANWVWERITMTTSLKIISIRCTADGISSIVHA